MRRDEGAAVPLIIGLFTVAVAFVVIAVAATSLHLERLRLLTVADAAALAGAESFRVADVSVEGDALAPRLRASSIRRTVDAFVGDFDAAGLDALSVLAADTADGRTATVRLRALWHPPIVGPLLPEGIPIEVVSTAEARFR